MYEDSPNLGYVSRGQFVEFFEQRPQSIDNNQLFSTDDPEAIKDFGEKVFNSLLHRLDVVPYNKRPSGQYMKFNDMDARGSFSYESGVESAEPGVGSLINLDFLEAFIRTPRKLGIYRQPFSSQIVEVIHDYITERKNLLNALGEPAEDKILVD